VRAAKLLIGLSDGLNRIALAGAILALAVMAFAVGYQVVARYVFAAPPIWTEELARRAMVWAGMLGASVAFHARSDPTLFTQMRELAGTPGKLLALIRAAGVTVFAVPVLYFSLFGANQNLARGFLGRSLEREAEMLGISMVWFTAAVPVAFVIVMVHVIAGLATHFAGLEPVPSTAKENEPV